MKLPFRTEIAIPESLQALYARKSFSVIVAVDIRSDLLPIYCCAGGIHSVGLTFDDQEDLSGAGCVTVISLRVTHAQTHNRRGRVLEYCLNALEDKSHNLENAFPAFVRAMHFASNVFVFGTEGGQAGISDEEARANQKTFDSFRGQGVL